MVLQVALQDVVLHGAEDEANVICVCGTSEVGVDEFILVWIKVDKHAQDEIFSCLHVPLGAWQEHTEDKKANYTI